MNSLRVPPHNLEAEEALLGALLLSITAIEDTVDVVDAGDYYAPQHQLLHAGIVHLWSNARPVDAVSLTEHLVDEGHKVAIEDINALINATPSVSGAVHYAGIVRNAARARHLIMVGGQISDIGFTTTRSTIEDAYDQAEALMTTVSNAHDDVEATASEALVELDEMMRAHSQYNSPLIGLPTGFVDWDALTLGLQPGTLNVVAGRPGMCKSVFALEAALSVAVSCRAPVLYGSLEMGRVELAGRITTSLTGIDSARLRLGRLEQHEWDQVAQVRERFTDAPLTILDDATLTMASLRSHARRLQRRHGNLGLIVVDYLQLMTAGQAVENRQLEVAHIARGLKVLSRELEVPVLAVAQVSRSCELRADKRPGLADLRESGEIENAADTISFLYRDEVYNPESPDRGMVEVHLAKHRAGPLGTVRLAFLGPRVSLKSAARP